MRRTKDDADATREALINAALRVFSRRGYSAATLDEVAELAGLTRGALYWHFKNKADLYNAMMRERFARASLVYQQALAGPGTVAERLRHLMVRSIEYLDEDEEYRLVLETGQFRTEMSLELESGMAEKRVANQALLGMLSGLVAEGQIEGSLPANLEPSRAALSIMAHVNGLIMTWLLDRTAFSPRQDASALVAAFWTGMKPD